MGQIETAMDRIRARRLKALSEALHELYEDGKILGFKDGTAQAMKDALARRGYGVLEIGE